MSERNLREVARGVRDLMLNNGVQIDESTGLQYYTGYPAVRLYDIDLYYEAIILHYLQAFEYSKNCIRLFLGRQRFDGFIPRVVERRAAQWSGDEALEHCKPFLAQTALFISYYENDFSWITREMFHRMRKYLVHWLDDCDRDGNGLSEWMSAPHAGADNQFERCGGWQANYCEGVDLNSYLVRECLALAHIGDKVGQTQQAIDLRATAAARKKKVQEVFWDDKEKIFYDRDRRTGKPIKVKYMMSFHTLWTGVATPEQAQASVERHLLDPKEFWTPYPAATYARTEPTFSQVYKPGDYSQCNFRASVWIPYNYWLMHGLWNYGFKEAAQELANKTYAMFCRHDVPREWYNSETGEGCGHNPFFGFSCIAPFMPLELEHGCDPTGLGEVELREKMDKISQEAGLLNG